MQILQAFKNLESDETDDLLRNSADFLDHAGKRARIHELKGHVHLSILEEGTIRPDDVVALALMQGLKFKKDLPSNFVVRLKGYYLQGYNFLSRFVDGFLYCAARALP